MLGNNRWINDGYSYQAIRKCNQIPNLKRFAATSRGCEISAFVDWNANLDVSKQQIESRINQKNGFTRGYSNTVERDESIYSSRDYTGKHE
jgi:hypothetical protein